MLDNELGAENGAVPPKDGESSPSESRASEASDPSTGTRRPPAAPPPVTFQAPAPVFRAPEIDDHSEDDDGGSGRSSRRRRSRGSRSESGRTDDQKTDHQKTESEPERDDAPGHESSADVPRQRGRSDKQDTERQDAEERDTESRRDGEDDDSDSGRRRRRRRGGRRRNKGDDHDESGGSTQESADGSARPEGDDAGSARERDTRDAAGKKAEQDKSGQDKSGQDKSGQDKSGQDKSEPSSDSADAEGGRTGGDHSEENGDQPQGSRRRRRRRRRKGEPVEAAPDDPENVIVRVREPRGRADVASEVTTLEGSTRLEAKKQRRREGRDAGRRRPPILTEAEFLARRESVERTMVIRQEGDRTQIGVLEDGVLVEHYVAKNTQTSLIGNVYLGRVQNVLPSMEAAFIDIGRGRNAVLYAGEVDWNGLGVEAGQPKRIESALKSGQSVLVQVTKDPVGHKGARLTSQISLPGRYLVYVPHGSMNGISRKLPDTERTRLKQLLKEIVPEDAGVVVRTAAEGASEEELSRDVTRLRAQWEAIEKKAESGKAPELVYAEPDLLIKVVRDLFTEDFAKLVVSGDEAWDMIEGYVGHVAPHLMDRVERWTSQEDIFTAYRIDEQIVKALDRKVWLPSGGSLIIERTEAMTVVDVNTGKFTGSGGNLEETVTKNNLEAAEEIVRQLRLRDIGGIIVVDFIDMVLESNRDLVLRRLVECLGRDRTKHQVAEVTSLGLVQMTRKRIGTGLFEAFSEPCEACKGRGYRVRLPTADQGTPAHHHGNGGQEQASGDGDSSGGRRGRRRRRGGGGGGDGEGGQAGSEAESRSESPAATPAVSPAEAPTESPAEAPAESGTQSGEETPAPPGPATTDGGAQAASDTGAAPASTADADTDEVPPPREGDDTPSLADAVEPDVEPVESGGRRRRTRRRVSSHD